jgi:hypothetical protein
LRFVRPVTTASGRSTGTTGVGVGTAVGDGVGDGTAVTEGLDEVHPARSAIAAAPMARRNVVRWLTALS